MNRHLGVGGRSSSWRFGSLFSFILSIALLFGVSGAWAADWTDANNVTYTALKSINGNGSGLIVTDIVPDGTEIVKFKYKPSNVTKSECIFCSRYYSGINPQAQFGCFRISSNFRFDRGNYSSASASGHTLCKTTPLESGVDYSVVANFGDENASNINAGNITINGTLQNETIKTVTDRPGSVLVLLASHNNAKDITPTSFGNRATGDLYYFQLWKADGETLKHDFRPAKRNDDKVVGLYDIIEQKFWPATEGSFLYEEPSVVSAKWTGAKNNDFSDPDNWHEGKVPESTSDITLEADIIDNAEWVKFASLYAGTIDLNGHKLAVVGERDFSFTVTDSSAEDPGELRITVPEKTTFNKTAAFGITGNLSLVKDGAGTLLWKGGTLAAEIPVTVADGVFKLGVTTENVFGTSGTITVKAPGQFDINYIGAIGPVRARTFYIEGDGPDGFGAIVNNANSTQTGQHHLNKIELIGDATIGGSGYIDIRGKGNGVDCGVHKLTVKNTGRFCVLDGHLTTATDIVVSGGNLWVGNACVLEAERIVLENGGIFQNYMDSGTKIYNVPFVVRNGVGTITSAKNWYTIAAPITVESGCTLNCPKDGPWYEGAITNKTDAILNVSGEFNALGRIFKNDGLFNHTAGKFVFGHRDNANYPCAVENNGTIKTSGGTFLFNAESSMTGTGTLELAGGSPQVLGDLSGFTGTIILSGATSVKLDKIADFTGTLRLVNGTVATTLGDATACSVEFDLSDKTGVFPVPASWLTLTADKLVTIRLGEREFAPGEKLISWENAPSFDFALPEDNGVELVSKADGLYYGSALIATAKWTGEANNGDYFDPGNWACYDAAGNLVSDVSPSAETVITLDTDVTSAWGGFNAAAQVGTIDLNGHKLAVTCEGDLKFAVTDTSVDPENPGELRITVPENTTFNKTAAFGITGNLLLVKDGPGTLLWNGGTLAAEIPVIVADGVFKLGVTTANVFGNGGKITVMAGAQFDINTTLSDGQLRSRTFYIEGEGPDGSGALVNSAKSTTAGRQINKIVLTGDATIGGSGYIDIRDNGNGVDCGGHELTVKNTGRFIVYDGYLTNATDIVVSGGNLWVCNSCVLEAERIVLENGGMFKNFMNSGTKTKEYNVPFIVTEGIGTIRSEKDNWYIIDAPITVESGCTLNCPDDGPWYKGTITNKTDAILNVSGEFNALGRIFKNDGLVNHTAGKFVFGHRDNANYPCAVENNGTIKTSGGTFLFNAESSMTGTGTLELAGGSPKVLGDLSGFTGTIILSGGTATVSSSFGSFAGTLVLKDGAFAEAASLADFKGTVVVDLSGRKDALDVDGKNWFGCKEILVDLGERELQYGDKVFSWTEKPAGVRFRLLGDRKASLRKTDNGLAYAEAPGFKVIVR